MTERVSTGEMIRRALDARLIDLHTALPGRVRSFDAAAQVADVEPMIKRAVPTGGEEDPVALETLPVLPSVPVLFPSGGGCFVSFPLAAGDPVLLLFCERDTSHYRATGDVADPGLPSLHPLSGAVCIPCNFGQRTATIGDVSTTDMVMGVDGGAANVTIKSARVEVGGSSDAAALASRVKNLETAFLGHTHGGVTTGLGSTLAQTTVPPYVAQTFDSTKLKVGG